MTDPSVDVPSRILLADLDLPRQPRQARSRAKRDAILAASARLFAERGYDATTTNDVAAAAGVSIGTVYAYFRDKRQIFLSLFAGNIETIQALGTAFQDWGADPRRTIRQALADALPYDPAAFALQRAWSTLQHRDPELAGIGEQADRAFYEQFVAAVRAAAAEDRTWPDLDIDATCWAVTQLLDQVWHTQLDPGHLSEAAFIRQRDAVADLVYRSIFKVM